MKKKFKLGFIFIALLSFTLTMIFGLTNPARNTYAQTYNSGEVALSSLSVGDVTKSGVTITNTDAFDVYIDGETTATEEGVTSYETTKDYTVVYGTNNNVLKLNTYESYGLTASQLMVAGVDILSATNKTVTTSTNGVTSGSAKLDISNGEAVLTLNNFVYSGQGANIGGYYNALILYKGNIPLRIVLVGNNTLTAVEGGNKNLDGINCNYQGSEPNVTICGSGKLSITSNNNGIYANGNLRIVGCELNLSINGYPIRANKSVSIDNVRGTLVTTANPEYFSAMVTGYGNSDYLNINTPTKGYTDTSSEEYVEVPNGSYDYYSEVSNHEMHDFVKMVFEGANHAFIYSKDGEDVVATCSTNECEYMTTPATLVITATGVTYDGRTHFLDTSTLDLVAFPNYLVTFRKDSTNGTVVEYPRELGTYYATVEVGGQSKTYSFEIADYYHAHNLTYTASGDTITASCSYADECGVTNEKLQIKAPSNLDYDGNAKVATFEAGYNTSAFPNPKIVYYQNDQVVDECINPGTYVAKVTYGSATAEVEFTIEGHYHDNMAFVAWTSTTSLPNTAGNYYLANDVTISSTWSVPTGTTNLCLNGHGIKSNGAAIISITSGKTLNIYDCDELTEHKFTVNSPRPNGAGVATVDDTIISEYKTFIGGYITGADAGAGAAINMNGNAKLNMYGGNIIGNKSSNDGVIRLQTSGAEFTMYGGTIQYNHGNTGGAVFVESNNTFKLEGGLISYNQSGVRAAIFNRGNVFVNGGEISNNYTGEGTINDWGGSITITGGIIKDNITNRAAIDAGNTIKISGNPTIIDNKNTSQALADLMLKGTNKLNIVGALDDEVINHKIGIVFANTSNQVLEDQTGVFTSGWATYMLNENPADYFVADVSGFYVGLKNGEAALFDKPQVARVGGNTYATLADAYAACAANGTIVLIDDIDLSQENVTLGITQNITLDLNGKILTFNVGQITLSGSAVLTIDNSKIKTGGIKGAIPVTDTAKIVFKNARLSVTKTELDATSTINTIADGFESFTINEGEPGYSNGFKTIVRSSTSVAELNGVIYPSLLDAINDWTIGDVIKLLAKIDLGTVGNQKVINKNIVIDLNGFIITSSNISTDYITIASDKHVTLMNSSKESGGYNSGFRCDFNALTSEVAYILIGENVRTPFEAEYVANYYTIEEGYTAVYINDDQSPDENYYYSIIKFDFEELDTGGEKPVIKVPEDKEEAENGDEITVDTNAKPIDIEWFYDDNGDGNPDDPKDPIGIGEKYKVETPKDKGHTIVAVIKQNKKDDGTDYPEGEEPTIYSQPIKVKGELVYYFQVGDKKYSDIKVAYEACQENEVITLLADYDTSELSNFYVTIERDIILDLNGNKLYGNYVAIKVSDNTTLTITNSKPETGGVADGIYYNSGNFKLFGVRMNLSASEFEYNKDIYTIAEGYEAVNINEDGNPDENGYYSIVRPKGRVIYENAKPYNFENETWFKGSKYDNIINIQGDYTFFGSDYFYNTESYGFSFVDSNQNYNNIFIKSKEFAEAPTSFYIAGGSGTQADPYIVAILTEFEELDTTTKPEIIIPGGKEVADDGDILTVDITGTDIIIEWFYDENGDGKPDSTTPVGTGAGYTVRFVDLKDVTHNDQGKTLVAVVTQKYDENGCELPKPLTIISKTAKVTNVFPKTKKLAIGTVYLIDEYIDVEADTNMKLGNVGTFPDIKVLAGLYKVAHVAGANNTLTQIAFGNMFKIYTGDPAGLDLPINGDEYMAPGNKVIGIRLVSGTGVAGDPYVFEVVYNTTYIALDPNEDIDIDTPNTPPRAKDGDEISIYTNSNPVIIEWYYDDDNDGDPDDPEHPIAIGPTYTVMCPDKNNPNHDDTGHTIIGVIKQDKDENGNPLDNPIEVTTNPIKVTGKEKPIEQGRVYYFNEFFDIETPIYVSGINEEIVPGQYKVSKPEGSDNGYDFKDLFKDASDNNLTLSLPKDTKHTLDDIIGIKCISGTGVATDPYVFEVFYNDSYKPLDPDDTINIIIPDDKKKAEDGDELEIDTEATDITIKWYYDDNGDGNPDDPDTPIGTGKKYTIFEPKDTGHKIIAVVTQEKKQDGTDYEDGEKPTVTSRPARVNGSYTPLDENSHPGVISTDPAFDKSTLEVDCDADDITVKWYYADEDGNPTGQPIGEGKTYTVKAPDTTTGQDDTGHKIVAVITQEKDEDGNDYPEGQKPQATTLTVQVYKPVNPTEDIEVKTTDDKERPGHGDTIEVDTDLTPIDVEWFYDDDGDGNPDDPNNSIGTGNIYTITEPQDTGHTIIAVIKQDKKPDGTDYGQDEEIPTTTTTPIKVHGYLPGEYVPLDPEDEPAPTVPNKPKLENGDEITIETDATDVIVKWYYTDEDGNPTGDPIGEGKTYTLRCPDANDPTHDDRDHNIIAVITQKYDENGDEYAAGEAPTQHSKPVTNIIPSHTHNFSYTAVGATITAKCNTTGCDITEGLKLTLLAPTGSMVCDDKERVVTIQAGYNTVVFGTPVIKYYKNDTEVTQCIDAGTYTAKVTIGNATAQISFTIEAWKPKTDATTSKDVPASEAQNIKVEVEGAGKNDDISVKVEVKTTLTAQETGKDFDKIQTKLESGEKITRVYEVKLIRTTNGVEEVIQPSDIKPGTKITVTMTLPEEVLNAESFKILHIHSATDTEFITDYVRNGNTVSFTVSRLSEFAFIIKGKGLAGWAIALIVIDSLLVAMAMAYLAIFFIFNKWIVINGKAIRVLVCGKKDEQTRVITLFLGIEYRNEGEVFNSAEEALGKIE